MAAPKGHAKWGGRQKGATNLVTRAKVAAVASVEGEIVKTRAKRLKTGVPAKARAGISPKDLLLDEMRNCWEASHLLSAEAVRIEAQAVVLDAALRLGIMSPEVAEIMGTPEGGPILPTLWSAKAAALREKAGAMRVAASLQAEQAIEVAKAAAPYEHAKLANLDAKLVGDIHVHVKTF